MITPNKSNLVFYGYLHFSTYFSHPSFKDWVAKQFNDDEKYRLVTIDFQKDINFIVQYRDLSDLSLPTRFYLCKTDYHLKSFSILYASPDYPCEEYGQTMIDDFDGKIAFIAFQSNVLIIDVQRKKVLFDEEKEGLLFAQSCSKNGHFAGLMPLKGWKATRLTLMSFKKGTVTKNVIDLDTSSVSLIDIQDGVVLFYTWETKMPEEKEIFHYKGINLQDGQYIDEKRATKIGKKVKAYWHKKLFAYCVTINYPKKGSVRINHPKKHRLVTLTLDELIEKNDYVRELSKSGFELCRGFYDQQVYLVWGRRNHAVPLDSEDHISLYDDARIFRYDLKTGNLSYMGYLDGVCADSLKVFSRPRK